MYANYVNKKMVFDYAFRSLARSYIIIPMPYCCTGLRIHKHNKEATLPTHHYNYEVLLLIIIISVFGSFSK